MRARGFALRDAFPDVLKGLITSEEAEDYPVDVHPAPVPQIAPKDDLSVVDMQSDQIGRFPLYLPDGSVYSTHDDAAGWIKSYADMIKKIVGSAKLSSEAKTEKMMSLKEANFEVTEDFDSFHKIKLRAEVVRAGGSVSPKPVSSLSADEWAPKEDES
jgi:hypothetical protein